MNATNRRCTYFQYVPIAAKKRKSGFQTLCFEVKNEDSALKSLKICNAGMASISIIPNKDIKRAETRSHSERVLAADSDCCILGDGEQDSH